MKINILAPTRSGGKFAGDTPHSSISGESVSGPAAPEDKIITDIDEEKMTHEKFVATRFLTFLGNQRLTLEQLNNLPEKEQQRIKKEFIGD